VMNQRKQEIMSMGSEMRKCMSELRTGRVCIMMTRKLRALEYRVKINGKKIMSKEAKHLDFRFSRWKIL
jgi:hypothetical protein